MPNITIYPGTFDPITNGHTDLIARAGKIFDKIIVAIAINPAKQPVFDLQQRISMAQHVLQQYPKVEVCSLEGLLVEFAQKHQAKSILRGLRAVADFEYEFQLAGMNRKLAPNIETLFLTPDEKYTYISSSLVREIASLGGDTSQFVHNHVNAELKRRLG